MSGSGPSSPPGASTGCWLRTHIYKIVVSVVIALLALQYAFSAIFEQRHLEPLFSIGRTPHIPHQNRMVHHTSNVSLNILSTLANESSALTSNATEDITLNIPPCPPVPPDLVGPIKVKKTPLPMLQLEQLLTPKLQPGGRHKPKVCTAKESVALVIPYRSRTEHLAVLLANLHPLLQHQQLDYGLFVVEQAGSGPFNRAKLMNVGFAEALKLRNYTCFIFHDVDLLPEDDRNLYTCPEQPRHMSVAVDIFRYKLPYADIFGGVSAMRREQFQRVNGFSNMFWGWGGEDDDMANRIKFHHLHISRYPANIAHYKMLAHKKERASPNRYKYLYSGQKRFHTDGLNSLKYELRSREFRPLYTWLLVDLGSNTS